HDDVLAAVQRLRPIATAHDLTLAQLAVAWVLQEPSVASAIVGASRPEQLADTTGGARVTLDGTTMQAIDDIVLPVHPRPASAWCGALVACAPPSPPSAAPAARRALRRARRAVRRQA